MSDIETVVRESMNYQGELHAMPSAPLIRRARRRRLVRGVSATAVAAGCATAAIAVAGSWPQSGTQPVATESATSPSTSLTSSPSTQTVPASDVISLQATDRVVTAEGAVIVVNPEKLCVGNTREEPSCLFGADPTLDSPSSAFGFYTASPKDFVYAWLTPGGTANATLKVGDAAPLKAALYQVEGREMLIAVVTGATCWSDSVGAELASTDAAGEIIYAHSDGGTCADSLPESNRG